MYEQYSDDAKTAESFPPGKAFRLSYDAVTGCMRVTSRDRAALSELRDAFSEPNPAAFFSQ